MLKYQLKFNNDLGASLCAIIAHAADMIQPEDAEDMLLVAGLLELRERMMVKLCRVQPEHSIKLTPVQALSLHLMAQRVHIPDIYMATKVQLISNSIHQRYA